MTKIRLILYFPEEGTVKLQLINKRFLMGSYAIMLLKKSNLLISHFWSGAQPEFCNRKKNNFGFKTLVTG